MSERSGDGWNGYLSGQCPVQGCGRVDGHPWYFRARGAAWSMEIAQNREFDPEILPVVSREYPGWIVERDWGTWPEAGYMDEAVAWQLIEETIAQFRAGKLELVA
jgi:hypothetical protein